MTFSGHICDIPGIRVGHSHDQRALTGCTVIFPDDGFTAGVDVRGSAPGTREIELLYPTRLVQNIDGILLTGGSAFGLDAASGVVQYLEEMNIGYDTGIARVPILPAAVIYDLNTGDPSVRPDKVMGYNAAVSASSNDKRMGAIGAGIGATVGKFAGIEYSMRGGIGSCSYHLGGDAIIAVLVVLNALGNIINPGTGETIAGAYNNQTETFFDPIDFMTANHLDHYASFTNTTLGVVATNVRLGREEATKVAQMANDGIARAISPSHTPFDGDIVFAVSTNTVAMDNNSLLSLGTVAAELVAWSIVEAVNH
ncbi:P1 family peptidase [candidate division KSB1 bacterium]|nr:P1 family peptidase [candidate division KSB1 bacterium]